MPVHRPGVQCAPQCQVTPVESAHNLGPINSDYSPGTQHREPAIVL